MKQEYHEEKVEELADDAALDEYVEQTFSKMYRPGFAIATGTVSGLLILAATLLLVLKGGDAGKSLRHYTGQNGVNGRIVINRFI